MKRALAYGRFIIEQTFLNAGMQSYEIGQRLVFDEPRDDGENVDAQVMITVTEIDGATGQGGTLWSAFADYWRMKSE